MDLKGAKSEKILIDMSPLKSGGGLQLAYNFLDEFTTVETGDRVFYLLVPHGGFQEYRKHPKICKVLDVPRNIVLRYIFDNTKLQVFLKQQKITKIFTFFGAGLPHPRGVQSIVGVAYPSICYDESAFWKYVSFKYTMRLRIVNYFWKRRLKIADVIFTETAVMKNRLLKVLPIAADKITIVPPAPSAYISGESVRRNSENILLLSGALLQKNLWRLYAVAEELQRMNCKVTFVVTVREEDWKSALKESNIDDALVQAYFNFVGSVRQKEIARVYNNAAALLLLSDLESFSNNHMEAWKVGIPQIVSDRDFCRAICEDSALYVEPHNPATVAQAIKQLMADEHLQNLLVENGKKRLALLPTQKERMNKIISLIFDGDTETN